MKKCPALMMVVLLLIITGCSGTSGPKPYYPLPVSTNILISGVVNIGDVAVSPDLGGIFPDIRASMIDHSHFRYEIEDDQALSGPVDREGFFSIDSMSLRSQFVIRVRSTKYPGFILEYMEADPQGLQGEKSVTVSIYSTARSFIARALRNRYGRSIDPSAISDSAIYATVSAIAEVLEENPEKISGAVPLYEVSEVVAAYAAAAKSLHEASAGVFPYDWTIMVYQAGDNSLDFALQDDLDEMVNAGPPRNCAVVVQSDSSDGGIRRFRLVDEGFVELKSTGPGNSANSSYLADFVAWAHRAYPARKFTLFCASHGQGWRNQPDISAGVISDDGSEAVMSLHDLKAGLASALVYNNSFRRPLELLCLDACLMGSIETACQLQDYASYIAFSQANVPAPGLPYDGIFNAIDANTEEISGSDLGKLICEQYAAYYGGTSASKSYSGTFSAVDSSKMSRLCADFANWTAILLSEAGNYAKVFAGVRDALRSDPNGLSGAERFLVQAFEMVDYRDLKDLMNNVRTSTPLANIAADQVLKSYSEALVMNVSFGERYKRATGMSISLPSPANFQDYESAALAYADLDFAKRTGWFDWLKLINSDEVISKVYGRSLAVCLSWNTQADLDLYIGEPDPTSSALNRTIWYSVTDGLTTPGGCFTVDSAKSGIPEEQWTANPFILPGTYRAGVKYYQKEGSPDTAEAKVSVTSIAHNTVKAKKTLLRGEFWEIAEITVASSGISIKTLEESEPETALKSPDSR